MRTAEQTRYEVWHYNGIETQNQIVLARDLTSILKQKVDHFHSCSLRQFRFQTRTGTHFSLATNWPRVGEVALKIIQALQIDPGVYLTPSEIAELTGLDSLRHRAALQTNILRLRKVHHEKGNPYFFQSSSSPDYRVCWPRERTWMTVERCRKPSEMSFAVE